MKTSKVDFFVDGYINKNSASFVPKSIKDLILEFIYQFPSDILMDFNDKLKLMELILDQLGVVFQLRRIYSGLSCGYSSRIFHEKCNNKGPTITIIKNEYDYIFGGYTSISWETPDCYTPVEDKTAFLFTVKPHVQKFLQKPDVYAVRHDDKTYGSLILFGRGCDLKICSHCNVSRFSYCMPKSFDIKSAKEFIGCNNDNNTFFLVRDIECFQCY